MSAYLLLESRLQNNVWKYMRNSPRICLLHPDEITNQLSVKEITRVTSDIRFVFGYPACFSGIRLSGRIVADMRPDSLIITKTDFIWRVAKRVLDEKNILLKFHTFITSTFKIKGALAQVKSNTYWTTVPLILINWTVNTQLHPMLIVFISPNHPCTKQNMLTQYQKSLSYSSSSRAEVSVSEKKSDSVTGHMLSRLFEINFSTNIFLAVRTRVFLQLHPNKLELHYLSWCGYHRALLDRTMFQYG